MLLLSRSTVGQRKTQTSVSARERRLPRSGQRLCHGRNGGSMKMNAPDCLLADRARTERGKDVIHSYTSSRGLHYLLYHVLSLDHSIYGCQDNVLQATTRAWHSDMRKGRWDNLNGLCGYLGIDICYPHRPSLNQDGLGLVLVNDKNTRKPRVIPRHQPNRVFKYIPLDVSSRVYPMLK